MQGLEQCKGVAVEFLRTKGEDPSACRLASKFGVVVSIVDVERDAEWIRGEIVVPLLNARVVFVQT